MKRMAAALVFLLFFLTSAFADVSGKGFLGKPVPHPGLGGLVIRPLNLAGGMREFTPFIWRRQSIEASVFVRSMGNYLGQACLLRSDTKYAVLTDIEGNMLLDESETRALISLFLPNPINGSRGEGCDQKVVIVPLAELNASMDENYATVYGFEKVIARLLPKTN
jgi:hypothetical protein